MRTILFCDNFSDPKIAKLSEVLASLSNDVEPSKSSFLEAEEALFPNSPDLSVVVLSHDLAEGLEVLRRLRRLTTRYLLAVGPAGDSQVILQALNCGADHYLNEEDIEAGLGAIISRFSRTDEVAVQGRVLAILGASGGCGASTLAANVATLFAKEQGKCALMDLKPGRGDLSSLLDLHPKYNLADVCLNAGRLDRAMFEKMLVIHQCGVHLLSSPPSFCDARIITAKGVTCAIMMARKLFSYVIVDVEDCFHDEQVAALKLASTILLVSRLDFTSLRNARKVMDHLRDLGMPPTAIRVVINRYGQSGELPVEEAEEALGEKLCCLIPDDTKTLNAANNVGVPAVLKFPKAKVCQSIASLVKIAMERRRTGAERVMAAS